MFYPPVTHKKHVASIIGIVILVSIASAFARTTGEPTPEEICIADGLKGAIQSETLAQKLQKTSGPLAVVFSDFYQYNYRIVDTDTRFTLQQKYPRQYLQMLMSREPEIGVPEQIQAYTGAEKAEAPLAANLPGKEVLAIQNRALDMLYASYADQGPERREELKNYQAEDKLASPITTHFFLFSMDPQWLGGKENLFRPLQNTTPISHIQLQISDTPEVKLNTERHTGPFDRKAGERWGDLGRALNTLDDLLPARTKELFESTISRRQRFSLMIQRPISWFLHSVNGDHLVFQVNDDVLKIMKQVCGEENLRNAKAVHVNGHEAREWRIVLNRDQMGKIEESLIRNVTLDHLEGALKQFEADKAKGATRVYVHMTALPFEMPVMRNLLLPALYEWAPDQQTKDNALHGFERGDINIHTGNIEAVIKALKQSVE